MPKGYNMATKEEQEEADRLAKEKAAEEAAEKEEQEKAAKEAARKLLEGKDKDLVDSIVKERLETELKSIKDNLDKAYKVRDEALKKAAEFEQKEKEANLKRLEEDGKHKEAYELRLAERDARLAALEKSNTELSRDGAVRDALKGFDFRNDTASDMAFKEIIGQLIQKDGQWVHRSGISIKDYAAAFAKSDEQSFLFKPKQSSGGGSDDKDKGAPKGDKGKVSLFDLPQSEVIKMATEGKLPNQQSG